MYRIPSLVAGLSLAFTGISTASAATLNVPSQYSTIQSAINASSNGDVIQIAPGTYYEWNIHPGNNKHITIRGSVDANGDPTTFIDGQQQDVVFYIRYVDQDRLVVENLHISGGRSDWEGGGMYIREYSRPIIRNCVITDNEALNGYGGGITLTSQAKPRIENCLITNNTSTRENAGGIYISYSRPYIQNSVICGNGGNSEAAWGGQIYGGTIWDEGGNCFAVDCVDCGVDSDGDGVVDASDQCPGYDDNIDLDADGIADGCDDCPGDSLNDIDDDGECSDTDPCPYDPQDDADEDGYCGCVLNSGCPEDFDRFPNDPTEWSDADGDGVGDNSDVFPDDPNESADFDGDTVGDNADAFPDDASEWADSDEDGVGDNSDAFPTDPDEWSDLDGDLVGDNGDVFPDDPDEWADSDDDGLGDNADAAPRGACCVSSGCVATSNADCTALGGTWLGEDGGCEACPASCSGDTNSDGVIDIEDLLTMLSNYGSVCP